MKLATTTLLTLTLACIAASPAQAASNTASDAPTFAQLEAVSPALAAYTQTLVQDEVWEREALSARDP